MTQNSEKQYRSLLKKLVDLRLSVLPAIEALKEFEYDFAAEPILLNAVHILNALSYFLQGKISEHELQSWAERLELFDDVLPKGNTAQETDEIIQAIFDLANPELSKLSTLERVDFIMSVLSKHSATI